MPWLVLFLLVGTDVRRKPEKKTPPTPHAGVGFLSIKRAVEETSDMGRP